MLARITQPMNALFEAQRFVEAQRTAKAQRPAEAQWPAEAQRPACWHGAVHLERLPDRFAATAANVAQIGLSSGQCGAARPGNYCQPRCAVLPGRHCERRRRSFAALFAGLGAVCRSVNCTARRYGHGDDGAPVGSTRRACESKRLRQPAQVSRHRHGDGRVYCLIIRRPSPAPTAPTFHSAHDVGVCCEASWLEFSRV